MEWHAGRASVVYYLALPKYISVTPHELRALNHTQTARLFRLYGPNYLKGPIFEFVVGPGGTYVYSPPWGAAMLDANKVEEIHLPQGSSISK